MKNKLLIYSLIGLGIFLFGNFTVYLFVKEMNRPKLPTLSRVSEFSLLDDQGKTFTHQNLQGKVWIAAFIFTTCSDICPIMSKNMAKLNRTFEKVHGVKLVSITVNPEYDQPEVLSKYKEQFIGPKDKWHFLTGDREVITKLAIHSFKLGAIDQPIFHSSYLSLVDRHGFIRGYYDGTNEEAVNKLFQDAAMALKEN